MLFGCSYSLSWGPIPYVVLSEAAASRVKEKTNLLASIISVLTTFVSSFTIPYLLDSTYAGLGGKVGFVYGGICAVMVVMAYFFIPELKGRSLEEIDQLFASGQALRKFNGINTRDMVDIYQQEKRPASVEEVEYKKGDVGQQVERV